MSDNDEGNEVRPSAAQADIADSEMAQSHLTPPDVDTEDLPLTEQVELQNSCDTYMSDQSNNDDHYANEEEETRHLEGNEEVLPESTQTNDTRQVNSSLEVETDYSFSNISTHCNKDEHENEEQDEIIEPKGQGESQEDIFDEGTAVDDHSTPVTRKRKGKCDILTPTPKKSRIDSLVNSQSSEDSKDSNEIICKSLGRSRKSDETVPALETSSLSEKTLNLSSSQEFSLRIEDNSSPTPLSPTKSKQSQDSDSWESHSKEKINISPGLGNSQKSVNSWSSHNEKSFSWSSHNEVLEGKSLDLKQEDEPVKEDKSIDNASVSPKITSLNHVNADGQAEQVLTEERLVTATIEWIIKGNKVVSASIKQMSLWEESQHDIQKPGRMSIQSSTSTKSSSSSGSVGLPGPFPLPDRMSIMSSVSSSTSSSLASRPGWDGPFLKPSVPGSRTSLTCGLCSGVFPQFEKTSCPLVNGCSKPLNGKEEEQAHTKPKKTRGKIQSLSSKPSSMENPKGNSSSESTPNAASTPTPVKTRGRPKKNPSANFQQKGTPKTASNGIRVATPGHTPMPKAVPAHEQGGSSNSGRSGGVAVLARWADGRYYPGWVNEAPRLVGAGAGAQVLVQFCDGKSKLTPTTRVVRADIITAGTLVLAATDTGDYEEALVSNIRTTGSELEYQVERETVTREVPFSDIGLLEATINELTLTDAQKSAASINFNDLSLENIVSGPRKRIARTPFGKMEQGSPTSSLVKRRKRQTTPEPSTSHGQTFGGPDSCSMDTDSSTQSTCSLDLRGREMKPLDIECSPPEVSMESRRKLSHYRRNKMSKSRKKIIAEPEQLVKALGPIPEKGSELFSKCVFLITYTEQVELNKGTDTNNSGLEDSASDSKCSAPMWKQRLRTQILNGGGKVYNALSHVAKEELPNTYLITDKPCNTPLYLQCLVNNIPIYSTSLIHKCCSQNRSFKEMIGLRGTKRLMAGYSLAKRCLVPARPITLDQPLKDKIVLLALSCDPSLSVFWDSLVRKLGGKPIIFKSKLSLDKIDVIVTDGDCDNELVQQACEARVPLVSLTWLQQCIITGEWRPLTEHTSYKYNAADGADSPEY